MNASTKLLLTLGLPFAVGCASTSEHYVSRNWRGELQPKIGSQELGQFIQEVDAEIEASPEPATLQFVEEEIAIPEESPLATEDTALPAAESLAVRKNQVPMEVNERVERWIKYFSETDRARFQRFLDRGEKFRPLITHVLNEYGIPTDLYYLAMIESGFATRARSHASAVGVWQFIRGTGTRYGLTINSEVDERMDVMRATVAAAAYLQDLHRVFQNWYLAMAAYNAGEGRILGAIMRAKTRDFWELAEKRALPTETMDYIPKFIAAAIIGHHPERFGFTVDRSGAWPELVAVAVPSRVRVADIARTTGVSASELNEYNGYLLRGITPGRSGTYDIWLPANQAQRVASQETALAKLRVHGIGSRGTSRDGFRYHRIRRGETLASIARRHNTTVHQLRALNNLRGSTILAGSQLRVARLVDGNNAGSTNPQFHRVRNGENLNLIARRYKVSVQDIMSANNLRSTRIYAGTSLRIPHRGLALQQHRVRAGENLTVIARRYGMSVNELKKVNQLSRNQINIGQVLKVSKPRG